MAERRALAGAVFLLLALASLPARAHQVELFAWAEGRTVRGRVAASGHGFPARVVAYAASGETVAEARADATGAFAFELPAPADLRIVADAGDGHRVEQRLRADELAGGAAPLDAEALPPALEAAVELALARQLGPLRAELAAFESRARWRDAAAALGYILGLSGAVFFALGRRRQAS